MATAGILDPRRGMINLTPEQIKRDREMADELLKSAMQPQPIQDWTQGAAQVLGAIGAVVRQRRADSAQRDNDAYNSQAISQLLAGGSSFPPAPASAGGIPAPAAQGQISASSPTPVDISGSRQDFVNALLPAAIEEGKRTGIDPRIIVAQAAQETGWGKSAPGNNYFGIKSHGRAGGNSMMTTEVINGQPVRVRDSFRGYDSPEASVRGYGDFMLQNPRYQAMRSAQGMDAQLEALQASGYATDPNYSRSVGAIARGIQLPQEVAAAGPMTAYSDPMVSQSPAAAAIQTQSPQETASAPPLPPPVNVSTPPAPPEQQMTQELAQSAPPVANPNVGILPVLTGQPGQTNMGGGDMLVRALQAMSDPRANEGTQGIAKLLVQQEMAKQEASREAAAKQAERQALWSREDQRNAVLDGRADRDYGLQREKFEADQRNATMTGDIREYEFAKGQGYQGSFADYQRDMKRAGAQNINMGTIPPGYQLVTDPVTNAQRMEPIPGSPVAGANASRADSKETMSSVVTTAASRAREAMAGAYLPTDGTVGSVLGKMPGTAAAEVRRQVAVLRSNATIESLNAMRRESPTGGALGNVTEGEGTMLANKAGTLDPDSPNFARDLDDFERTLLRTIHGKEAGDAIYEKTRTAPPPGQPQQESGGPVQIKTVDDYNSLPSGTQYIDPNGKLRTKQ